MGGSLCWFVLPNALQPDDIHLAESALQSKVEIPVNDSAAKPAETSDKSSGSADKPALTLEPSSQGDYYMYELRWATTSESKHALATVSAIHVFARETEHSVVVINTFRRHHHEHYHYVINMLSSSSPASTLSYQQVLVIINSISII